MNSKINLPGKIGKGGLVMEEWKDIKGYEGLYQVSNLGRVRSLDRILPNGTNSVMLYKGVVLKAKPLPSGYLRVLLRGKDYYIHRIVATEFIDNPNNLPEVNHKDEDKTNNNINNLEWCTNKYNINYGSNRERASKKLKGIVVNNKPILQLTKSREIIKEFISAVEASKQTQIDNSSICKVANGKLKTSGGFIWRWSHGQNQFAK